MYLTTLNKENHQKTEAKKSKLTGVRASGDVLGVEVVDLSCGQENVELRGQEWKKHQDGSETQKIYAKNVKVAAALVTIQT